MSEDIQGRLLRNLERVASLITSYERRTSGKRGRPSVADIDPLRAAVVFLHATLEDVMRSVLAERWPMASEPELFRRVPFVLRTDDRQPERLSIGELAEHFRGRSVDDVISDAIGGYLKRSNINDVADLVQALRRCGLEPAIVARHAGRVQALMQRRHWIVHRADRNERSGSGHHLARSLGAGTVRAWKAHVEGLCRAILASL